MKALILSLCTLTGVVDVQESDVMTVVISSPLPDIEPEIITVVGSYLKSSVKEGDEVEFTALVGESFQKYCHNPL